MIRRVFALLAVGALAVAPASFAQDDLEGLPTTGLEKDKGEPGDLLLRLGFTFASSVVPETVRMHLDRVADVLASERANSKVEIAGHTDALGPEEFNQVLSERRAESVKAYLAERGVAAERISVLGYGESKPRDTNDTVEGRRLNRRVEIKATD